MFIVIEGIDGAGCETQSRMVLEKLKLSFGSTQDDQKKNVFLVKFPHYDTPVGKMIKDFLYLNQKMKAHEQFLLYTLQFIFDVEEIRQKLQKGSLIADRYFTTTLCYQTLEGFDEKVALRYADDFGIIKPDLVFFLDVKPETAIKWKYGEGKKLNFREKDLDFMKKTYEKYQDLINRQTWTKWVRINGEQEKEKVTEEIIKNL
ncbi:dTMP kinase [Candidatus Roizmanbacteria bacterium]|nr:dTMP kinase [Candidatus Roizmanbacteria bacterium]